MPKVAFLVAASPNASFYSQIAAIDLALKALPWRRWEPELQVSMGSRAPFTASNDSFDRWRPYLRDVAFNFVAETQWDRLDNWAQTDATLLLAPRNADAYVSLDADTFPVGGLEPVLDEVAEKQSIAGVMAHFPPAGFSDVRDWGGMAEKIQAQPLDCSFTYSLMGADIPDEKRRAPIYFNGGVIFYSRHGFDRFVEPYMAMRAKLIEHAGDFSGQVAVPFAISESGLRAFDLPLRYNYPNDDGALALHPGELENAVIFHYLRTQFFDRSRIFTSADEYAAFLALTLTGTNLAFQNAVRRILGPSYPFA